MLNSKLYFFFPPSSSSCSFCLASHQLSFHFIHHYLHIILIISTLSLASADGFVRLCVSRRHFWVQAVLDRQTKHVLGWKCGACVCVCVRSLSFSCFVEQYATHHKWTLICLTVLILPYDPGLDHLEERKWSFEVRSSADPAKHWHI